ncbi:hypothetical protein STW0522KLE44_08060 [Klebsiella sp. STW0522-44]|nr:hypothetical protein STW0522KLE44_08060 [Klebsiella sp. STW0522-44]
MFHDNSYICFFECIVAIVNLQSILLLNQPEDRCY